VAKVYFILGCTASGKGALGCALAERLGGQIISIDSMKVYRRMDIGTAKPSLDIRRRVPHHCIDIVEPSEEFSVAQYVEHADASIASVRSAGAIPLAVGGTNLYIQAMAEGLFEGPSADQAVRAALKARADAEGTAALHAELAEIDPDSAGRIHPNDAKRIIRALEVYEATGRPISELQKQWGSGRRRYDCVFIGMRRDKEDLHRRINARVKRMVAQGLPDEVAALLSEPAGLSATASAAVGYAEMIDSLQGRCSLQEATEAIKIHTRRLARKQRTWQRRWSDVQWFDVSPLDEKQQVEAVLSSVKFE